MSGMYSPTSLPLRSMSGPPPSPKSKYDGMLAMSRITSADRLTGWQVRRAHSQNSPKHGDSLLREMAQNAWVQNAGLRLQKSRHLVCQA